MSLANVALASSDFELIHDHLMSHEPRYRNMHLREVRQRAKKRVLRYLHAMRALPGEPKTIEGMISGPGVLWHYRIAQTKRRTQLSVLQERGDAEDLERIGRRFLIEIRKRVSFERSGERHRPKRLKGHFYLRRGLPGTPSSHPTCRLAVGEGVLDELFVSKLSGWGFELLCPGRDRLLGHLAPRSTG